MDLPVKLEPSQDVCFPHSSEFVKQEDAVLKTETEEIGDTVLNRSLFSEADDVKPNNLAISELTIPCQFCEFKTKWKTTMIKHIESKHSEVPIDVSKVKICKFCSFIGSCRKELRLHNKMEHNDLLKVFSCHECSYTSNWEEKMKLHNKFHGVMKDYPGVKCDFCDFIYKYNPADQKGLRKCKQILNEHMNDEHAEFKLNCNQCEKTVWTQQQLKVHKTKHEYSVEDGSYGCDKCDYKCKKAHRLKFHIDTVHLGVKTHLCELCPAAFATKNTLNKHILSHTDERNFKCKFCEKAFHTKGNLETHIR
jgi:KRAB domain-containing zinc finger protein